MINATIIAAAPTSDNYRTAMYIVRENMKKRHDLMEHYARMDARAPYYYEESERYIIEDVYYLTPTRQHHIYDSFEDAADAALENIWRTWCAMNDDEKKEYDNNFDDFESDAINDYYLMPLHEWRANARRARYGNNSVTSNIDHVVNMVARGEW